MLTLTSHVHRWEDRSLSIVFYHRNDTLVSPKKDVFDKLTGNYTKEFHDGENDGEDKINLDDSDVRAASSILATLIFRKSDLENQ